MRLVSIGRADGNDIRLDDETVSRRHAEIIVTDRQEIFLTDCASSSGTLVLRGNEWEPVRQAFVDADDWLKLGKTEIAIAHILR